MAKGKKFPLAEGQRVAEEVMTHLRPFAKEIVLGGSVARKCAEVGDVDLVAIPKDNMLVAEFINMGDSTLRVGGKVLSVIYSGTQLDLWIAADEELATLTQFVMGSAKFNIYLRAKAKRMGLMLGQYGLFVRETRTRIPLENEKALFLKLEEEWVPYTERSV